MSEIDLAPLRPYWYPVALASEVQSDPAAVTVLDEQVVVYCTFGPRTP